MKITNGAAKTPGKKTIMRIPGGHTCVMGPISYDLSTHTMYRSYHVTKDENMLLFVYDYAADTLRANKDSGYSEQDAKDIAKQLWKTIDADAASLAKYYITPVENPSFNVKDGDKYPRW